MTANLLLAALALTFCGALLAGILPRTLSRAVAVAAALGAAVLSVWAAASSYGAPLRVLAEPLPWLAGVVDAPAFGLLLDPLGAVMLLAVAIIGLLTVLYSTAYLEQSNRDHPVRPEEHPRYYFWLLLFIGSMLGIAVAPTLLQLLFFWELTTLCSWALISFHRDPQSLRAGFKALVMTHAGGLGLLLALLVLVALTGSFDFAALAQLSPGARTWAFVGLLFAAWAKAAQVPLHTWLPDAMAAPTPISAYLHAAAMVKAGVFLLARTTSAGWGMPPHLAYCLGVMALVTIFIALSYYFVQDDLKRLLAYSTIAHLGYVLLGVALGALGISEGFRGGVLHIICHSFGKATLFLCAGSVAYITGSRSISQIRGLGRTMPLTATAFFVGVLSVTGVPPFSSFWSKVMIFAGALKLPGALGPTLLVILLAETLVSFAWLLYVAQRVFLGEPSPVAQVNSEPPWPMSGTLVVLMIGCLAAPAIGLPFVKLLGH